MNIGEEYTVKIIKMINEGYGIAKVDNFPIFIEGVCPEDEIKIKINKINKTYAKAEILEIINPSTYRIKAACPIYNACGSCNWQHIDYDEQLRQKQNIVYETLKNITGKVYKINKTIPSPKILEYRCKIQMPVAQTKVSKRILIGYYKKNSHELINIKYCPMHPSIINDINEYIREKAAEYNISGYNEETHKGLLRHIIYRISSDKKQIFLIFVINDEKLQKSLISLSKEIKSKFDNICGISVNYNTKRTNVIMSRKTENILGDNYYTEELSGIKYKVSANSFFQVNPLCAELIFNKVKELISERITKPTILDAYSGVSSFGIWLSSTASEVTSVEEVESASADAKENILINNISNLKIVNGDAAESFKNLIKNNTKFDVSIIDPPRKGCSEDALNYLVNLTSKYIIYVSCNIATLARDIKILSSLGFEAEYIQPADMFPNTHHVETIALLEKK